VNTEVKGGFGAGLADHLLDSAASLVVHFLDAPGVDAPIADERFEGMPGHLAAQWIKAREHDHARGIIDDYFDAGDHFKRANVAPIATDDAPLHVVEGDGYYRKRTLDGQLPCETLDSAGDDFLGL